MWKNDEREREREYKSMVTLRNNYLLGFKSLYTISCLLNILQIYVLLQQWNNKSFLLFFLLRILNINRSVTQYLIEVDVSVSHFGSQCDPKVIESPPNNVVLDSSVNLKWFFFLTMIQYLFCISGFSSITKGFV